MLPGTLGLILQPLVCQQLTFPGDLQQLISACLSYCASLEEQSPETVSEVNVGCSRSVLLQRWY